MFNTRSIIRPLCVLVFVLSAPSNVARAQGAASKSDPLPASITRDSIPADAMEIADAMKVAKVGQEIALRGRIAMAKDAFVDGRAIFTLIDDSAAVACSPKDGKLTETCDVAAANKATIQIVDGSGSPQQGGLQDRGGLKHGAEVFVVGQVVTANGSDALVVSATGIHVPRAGLPVGFFAREAPESAKDLSEVRKTGQLKKGDMVEIRGMIGGSKEPFVAGRAMFTLMGGALKPCSARPGDKCPTPWDYCCETQNDLKANSATIRVADDKGNPLRTDFKGRMGIKELSQVVVVGTVVMADRGIVIVEATKMHVVKP